MFTKRVDVARGHFLTRPKDDELTEKFQVCVRKTLLDNELPKLQRRLKLIKEFSDIIELFDGEPEP